MVKLFPDPCVCQTTPVLRCPNSPPVFAHKIFGTEIVNLIPELLGEIANERPQTIHMRYLPDERDDDDEPSMFPEEKPEGEGWRTAKAAQV